MTDILLSTLIGGESGSSPLIMPKASAIVGGTYIKTSAATVVDSNNGAFFTAVIANHSDQGWEGVQLQAAVNTSEQTIIDLTGGAGVLTHVLAPCVTGSGATITIRVTTDGTVKEFEQVFATDDQRFGIGHFMSGTPVTLVTSSFGPGTGADGGYTSTAEAMLMTIPMQALNAGIGMPFSDSLKVTVQSTVAFGATTRGKAAVVYAVGKLGGE